MTDAELDALHPIGRQVRTGGQWWTCGAIASTWQHGIRERTYMLHRGSEVFLAPASVIDAVRDAGRREKTRPRHPPAG